MLGVPSRLTVLALAAAGLSACGQVEADPRRFEAMAEQIAAIPIDGRDTRPAGLRPAVSVEVLSPHALWDARDADAAPPVLTRAALQETPPAARPAGDLRPARLQPAAQPSPTPAASGLVQLGAYASETAARAAWTRLQSGDAAWAVEGLAPVLEAAEVDGRQVVRLKTRAPGAGAAALCAAAGVDDPWCHRGG